MSALLLQILQGSSFAAASSAGSGVTAPTLTGSPTLVASWDFDKSSTITLSGSDIDTISGADGTSYTLSTPAAMPSQETRGGKYCARFTSASSEYMSLEAAGVMANTSDGAHSIVVIGEFNTNAASASLAGFSTVAGTINTVSWLYCSSGTTGFVGRRANQNALAAGGTYSTGSKHLVILCQPTGSAAASLYLNGTATPVTSASAALDAGCDAFVVGAIIYGSTAQTFLDGWVWRVLVYSTALDATQVEEIATWAASNYGTPNNT